MNGNPPPSAARGPDQAVLDRTSRLLSSNWAFGLTLVAARRRRFIIILLGAIMWASLAYTFHPPTWDPAVGGRFLSYPFRALFKPSVFAVIFLLSAFFGIALFLARRYLPGARGRSIHQINVATAVLFGLLWAFLGYRLTPPDFDPNFSKEFLAYPFEALFAAHIFRHVVIAALAIWLAYRIAAVYLDDIFEIGDITVAERFILQAAFASQYNTISIQDGEISPNDRNSPIVRIGGPGYVRVYLENAALFEKIDGSSRVIGPTVETKSGVEVLAGFERLRSVINLLDQSEAISLEERTLDGIRVCAEDVNFVFSVYRGGQPSTLMRPYPFSEDAIKKLVYRQGKTPHPAIMSGMIRGELARFIAKHSLNEFLASISIPEVETTQSGEADLQEALSQASSQPEDTDLPLPGVVSLTPPAFISRSQMMAELFAAEFDELAADRGVELKWAGMGTFATPNEIVPARHLEAWLLSRENLLRGGSSESMRIQREGLVGEMIRLVQEVPILTFRRLNGEDPSNVLRSLLIAYHGKLIEAYELYKREGSSREELDELEQALVFLSRFTGRWLRGSS